MFLYLYRDGKSPITRWTRKGLSTLKDRLSGRVIHGAKPGPLSYLSNKKEGELANFLTDCASVGYGKTRTNIAQSVAGEKGEQE